jgi:hypothetical protein
MQLELLEITWHPLGLKNCDWVAVSARSLYYFSFSTGLFQEKQRQRQPHVSVCLNLKKGEEELLIWVQVQALRVCVYIRNTVSPLAKHTHNAQDDRGHQGGRLCC